MLRVIHLGLGDIGKNTIAAILKQPGALKLIGVVDTHPALAGKNLRDIMGSRDVPSLPIFGSIKEALAKSKGADLATMTTGSRTEQVRKTLEELIAARIHVVTSCEELSFPDLRAPKIAAALNRAAIRKGVTILGTGVNPGFAMDAFALACTAPCTLVNHIKVIRSLDASKRRLQLQKKVGAGLSLPEAKTLIRKRLLGHVGLGESVAMIAAGLGWKLDDIKEEFHPVIADHAVSSEFIQVQAGQVRGMWMLAQGIVARKKLIELDLLMAFDADTFDEVVIDGDPPLLIRVKSGFPGESSTIGMMVNSARLLPTLQPGIRTMLDVLKIRSIGV